jgi:hypothetical protein
MDPLLAQDGALHKLTSQGSGGLKCRKLQNRSSAHGDLQYLVRNNVAMTMGV